MAKMNAPKLTDNYDAIVVLTGDAYRIDTGFRLLVAQDNMPLFITGVYKDTSLEDLIDISELTRGQKNYLKNHCCITLDYAASTTAQNVSETLAWMDDQSITSALIVTSDYHVPRTKLLFDTYKPSDSKLEFMYYPVQSVTDWSDFDYFIRFFKEYHKTIFTTLALAL